MCISGLGIIKKIAFAFFATQRRIRDYLLFDNIFTMLCISDFLIVIFVIWYLAYLINLLFQYILRCLI
jgi:hypothetical protein